MIMNMRSQYFRYFVALVLLVSTTTFAVEMTQELKRQLQEHPEKTCELTRPIPDLINRLTVPLGAQHREATVWRQSAPDNFQAVLALMQVVSVAPCARINGEPAKVVVYAMRLIGRDLAGSETTLSQVTDFSTTRGTVFKANLFQRLPHWYPENGTVSNPAPGMTEVQSGVLTINMESAPESIYHGWTEPQAEAKPGMVYAVEMDVEISGPARLQMGTDFWRYAEAPYTVFDQTCEKSNNCEGSLSRWFGPTNGRQTIRFDAFSR